MRLYPELPEPGRAESSTTDNTSCKEPCIGHSMMGSVLT